MFSQKPNLLRWLLAIEVAHNTDAFQFGKYLGLIAI